MQCVILAGGLGTRMQPWTAHLPKTLIRVRGVPFAHYQLAWLARQGVRDVVYSVAVKADMVRDFVGDGSRWDLAVRYVEDGKDLVGTAGALRRALDVGLLCDRFFVLYGDSFLPFDYCRLADAFADQWRPAMMAVFRNQNRFDTGNVRYDGGGVRLYRKAKPGERLDPEMDYIDYGIAVLTPAVIEENVPPGARADLADVYHRLSIEGRLAGFEVTQRFYEIGSPAGLADFERWLDANVSTFRELESIV
jgi:NDP-sugar pyrophosphorylase family protein